MYIFHKKSDVQHWIEKIKNDGHQIGFVPTMGALHHGHLALFNEAALRCHTVTGSIFVNPTQFNEAADFNQYPKTFTSDIYKLNTLTSCQGVYAPEPDDIYEDKKLFDFDFDGMDQVWEGAFRPGHYKGVINVVDRLFRIFSPDHVFFGQKDFQQCRVIEKLIEKRFPHIQFHQVPTVRESSGLAMSSRNVRLKEEERKIAETIPEILAAMASMAPHSSPSEIKKYGEMAFKMVGFEVDYIVITDQRNLKETNDWLSPSVILFAGKLPSVRLIDNWLIPAYPSI